MNNLKKPLVAIVQLVIFVGISAVLLPSVSHGQGGNSHTRAQRKFYLTTNLHKGNEALIACASGYHMASLWEIRDASNLRYDTTLGFKRGDSGSGPPANTYGWIRTGWDADESGLPGSSNCNAWTSASPFGEGTAVALQRLWKITDGEVISPWTSLGELCFEPTHVWCVQD